MANGNGSNGSNGHGGIGVKVGQALEKTDEKVRGSQAWTAIFRPGSVFRRGYTDSPRNRSYVIMNNVLYHLHPVKVKRHAVKVSYTLCLGGLSFFLFILLTITGIFLMLFYRPTAASAWRARPWSSTPSPTSVNSAPSSKPTATAPPTLKASSAKTGSVCCIAACPSRRKRPRTPPPLLPAPQPA